MDDRPLYAEIAVGAGGPQRQTFTWLVPAGLAVQRGSAVAAPWRTGYTLGIVLRLTRSSEVADPRPLERVIGRGPLLSAAQLETAEWISERYLAPLFSAIALFLPPQTAARVRKDAAAVAQVIPEPPPGAPHLSAVPPRGELERLIAEWPQSKRSRPANLLELLADGCVDAEQAARVLGGPERLAGWLQGTAFAAREGNRLRLKVAPGEARASAAALRRTALERRRLTLLRLLAEGAQNEQDARRRSAATARDVEALIEQGLIARRIVRAPRPALAAPQPAPTLTADQARAAAAIEAALEAARAARALPRRAAHELQARSFLLHGVTGSGKTEVYLAAAANALAHGEGVIVLVPEIALAPQALARFEARFPGRVAVRHSELDPRDAREQWRQVHAGEKPILIGPRSALFGPLSGPGAKLGLIVIDEEHEWSYKQAELQPRYHARAAAERLAAALDAVLVLGSATPDVVSMSQAQAGRHQLLELPLRVESGAAGAPAEAALPSVEIVDLREELRRGNRSVFSAALNEALGAALERGEQALLFLNRRGLTAYVCRACGAAVECSSCQLPLTLHRAEPILRCHECGRRSPLVETCSACGDPRVRPMSFGVQRLEDELHARFGGVPVSRWDRDAVRAAGGHARILEEFAGGRTQVLIGTQMIAKGLDIPSVTVVGVMNADLELRRPDFTAPERTFQLLTQVAGRAGRGRAPGRVIIQTYAPDHYAVQAAAAHDYEGFYEAEMRLRAPLDYPPFGRLALITCSGREQAGAAQLAERLAAELRAAAPRLAVIPPQIVGPSEAWPARLRGSHRRRIVLRGADPAPLLRLIELPRGCSVEIDPVSLL